MVRILLPDKILVTANLIFEFDEPYQLFEFPLGVGSEWGIQSGVITIDGTISSKWLNILDSINNLAKLFNVELIPESFAKYLPLIDISEFLSDQEIPTEIEITEIDKVFRRSPFEIDTMQQVTVEAGSFNTYNIELLQGSGEFFYSPDAEIFVKISGNVKDFIPIAEDINMELKYIKQ